MKRGRPVDERRVFDAARRVRRERRSAFVEKVCRENEELRERVKQLLEAAEQPSVFLRPPTAALRFATNWPEPAPKASKPTRGPALEPGIVIADRYRIGAEIGQGSSGVVYRATDEVLKTTVAVKIIDLESGEELEQLRREAATLRWLRLPGVVSLQDDGVDKGRPFIVTALVDGVPFPGAVGLRRWDDIREMSVGLLETLARIHAQGVIHGDLKPANVLVDAKGVPTVLDVGIASGPSIDFGESESQFAGTPSYMAPERMAGAPASVATDLYAVGVMLHHALCGVVPHHAETRTSLFERRSRQAAEPIHARASHVPSDAAEMIDALLARDPEDRPASAYDALDLLEHLRHTRPGSPDYPWLGSRELVDKLVHAANEGRSLDIWGPLGSGKTRTLMEAAKEIEALGRTVVWLRPATEAIASLAPLLPAQVGAETRTLQETARVAEQYLTAKLAAGVVIVADGVELMDRWSYDALSRARAAGTIWTTSLKRAGDAIETPRLETRTLERLFVGNNRIFHLPEDAAAELRRRTGGIAGRALEESASWVRAGLATWEGDRVHVDPRRLPDLVLQPPRIDASTRVDQASEQHSTRSGWIVRFVSMAEDAVDDVTVARALDAPIAVVARTISQLVDLGELNRATDGRVSARSHLTASASISPQRIREWHSLLADVTPTPSLARVRHLAISGRHAEIPATVLTLARNRRPTGAGPLPLSTAVEGLRLAARFGAWEDVAALAPVALGSALASGTEADLELAAHVLLVHAPATPNTKAIVSIARAAMDALRGRPIQAIDRLRTTMADVDLDPDIRRHLESVRIFAARSLSVETEERFVMEAADWASRQVPNEFIPVAEWVAWLRYRQLRFEDAADLQARHASSQHPASPTRAAALLAAASALLEVGDYARAEIHTNAARVVLSNIRSPLLEVRYETITRVLMYRQGAASAVDTALLDAVSELRNPPTQARVFLTETAIAWRAGDLTQARALSPSLIHFARLSGHVPTLALALGLGAQTGMALDQGECMLCLERLATLRVPYVQVQVAALLHSCNLEPRLASLAEARDVLVSLPESQRTRRREVLSIDEALAILACSPGTADGRSARVQPQAPSV